MDKGLATKPPANAWTHQGLQEYSLVVQPGREIEDRLMCEKELLQQLVKQKPVADTSMHIKIAEFHAREDMESTILRYMQRIFSNKHAFHLSLNNYGGFPPSNIYLRIQDIHLLQNLAKGLNVLDDYIISCACPRVRMFPNPHLSLARKLPEDVFEKALLQYAHKTFHETFSVHELVLLRRSHKYEPFKRVNVFKLLPEHGYYS